MRSATSLIEPVDVTLPALPTRLEGLRIAHLTDLHIRRERSRYDQLAAALKTVRVDIAVFTGDYMTFAGDEQTALKIMGRLIEGLKPRIGAYGVFGNHDSVELRRALAAMPVRWLFDEAVAVEGYPLVVVGFNGDRDRRPDSIVTLKTLTPLNGYHDGDSREAPIRLLLSHWPTWLATAADLKIDLQISGHTHGGQWRLPFGKALVNSTDFPPHLTSGILRLRDTLAVVSRGIGEVVFDVRFFCKPHVPIYTLRRGSLPGRHTKVIKNVRPW